MIDNTPKIEKTYLETISNSSVLNFFGDWTQNIQKLNEDFSHASPFEHIVIDNFLEESYAEKLSKLYPPLDDTWHEYKNPIEVKYAFDNINSLPLEVKNYFYYLSTPEIINIMNSITNIPNLEYDEYLHGAGLHIHPRYGRLNIHLDYEKHPFSGKERRINVILFISKDWDITWNGANELWNSDVSKCISKTDVKFNRAILFKTNDISWHGLPKPIMCPEGQFRKTLAFYYVSPLTCFKTEYRNKAKYILTDDSIKNDLNLQNLCKIRSNRRLTIDDIKLYCPDWKKEDM